jgi:hypothetical protein
MPRRASANSNRWLPILAWTTGAVVLLIIAALLIGQVWLNRYLRSEEFRGTLEQKTGVNMRAKVSIAPIVFEGTQFACADFTAQGAQDAAFSLAKVEDVRGDVSLPSIIAVFFGQRKFRVPSLDIQKLTLEFFDRDQLPLVLPPKERREDRSVIENLIIRDVRLAWGGGGLNGASVHARAVEGGWQIDGEGGRLVQLGLPPIDVVSARIIRKEGTIFLQNGRLRQNGGELALTGEIASEDKADLLLNVSNVAVNPFLKEDWRARLHGALAGEIRVQVPLKKDAPRQPKVDGKLRLDRAVLEALPILNKIADYLRTEQFRRIELNQASADVHFDAKGLRVENLVLESKQLIVLRGGFTFADGIVNGSFDVGVTPGPLQWIPGSQTKVFSAQKDGYVWAPMRITGPPDALKEDLSSRLVSAAQAAVVEKVEKTATEAVDTAVEGAKKGAEGVFDLLFGK